MELHLDAAASLPVDADRACLVGRAWIPGSPAGPSVVVIAGGDLIDISQVYSTTSQLLESEQPAAVARAAVAHGAPIGRVADVLANTSADPCESGKPFVLDPCG